MVHLICAKVWGSGWTGKQIEGHTDNMATFYLLKNGRSDIEFRLQLAREFWFLESKFDFKWNPHYINTKDNHHSDALSRWGDEKQREKFYQLTENSNAVEINISDDLFKFDPNIWNLWHHTYHYPFSNISTLFIWQEKINKTTGCPKNTLLKTTVKAKYFVKYC